MKVIEFLQLEKSGAIFKVFDANQPGYMNSSNYFLRADRNVVIAQCSDRDVVGFSPAGKTCINLYVK